MTPGWPIATLLQSKVSDVEQSVVDCGTCPVSIQCVLSDGGTGWRYDCCGSAAVEVPGPILLILDCQKNTFRQSERAEDMPRCPLCDGDLVKSHVLGMSGGHHYVPTVHAKHPPRVRLALFKKTLPIALALKAEIDERLKG